MRTAVIAVAKLENNYIREWTEWYKNLGFTNVIIYDNNDYGGERICDPIRDYFDSGFAIVKPLHNTTDAQYLAYQNGYLEYGSAYDWIAFFDIDEFLVLNERFHNNIEEFLSMGCFIGRDLIRVTWRHYGDNDLLRVVDGDYSVMKRFTKLSKQQFKWTKAIVRGGILDFMIHNTSDGIPHLVLAEGIRDAVDANGIPIDNKSIRNGCGYENAALNHYSTKTIEEFVLTKMKRGYPLVCLDPKILNMDYFFGQNRWTQEKEDLYNELISNAK
jgi:hypothetical protein